MALPKMLIAILAIKPRLRWSQMEMRNLLGTGAKVTHYVLAKRLVALAPVLANCGVFNLRDMI